MSLSVYQGMADNVSLPSVLATHERYDANVAGATAFVKLEGYEHSDYVNAGAEVLQAGNGRELVNFETVEREVTRVIENEAQQPDRMPEQSSRAEQAVQDSGMEMA